MQEDKVAFKAATHLAMSMTKLCKNIPLPKHVKPDPQREKQLPIHTLPHCKNSSSMEIQSVSHRYTTLAKSTGRFTLSYDTLPYGKLS